VVVGFISTYAISVYYRESCELNSHKWRYVIHATFKQGFS